MKVIKLRTWHKGFVLLDESGAAYAHADRLRQFIRDAQPRLNELRGAAEAAEFSRESCAPYNEFIREHQAQVVAAIQALIDMLPDLDISGHAKAAAACAELSAGGDFADMDTWGILAAMHRQAAEGLLPSLSSGVGSGRRSEIPPKYQHPRQAEIDQRAADRKAKAEATRAEKREAERLIESVGAAAGRMWALLQNPVEVGRHYARESWGGKMEYAGQVKEITPDGCIIFEHRDTFGRGDSAAGLVLFDPESGEAPETITCGNCDAVLPVMDEPAYSCCCLPPRAATVRGAVSRAELKIKDALRKLESSRKQAVTA